MNKYNTLQSDVPPPPVLQKTGGAGHKVESLKPFLYKGYRLSRILKLTLGERHIPLMSNSNFFFRDIKKKNL